MRVGQSAVSLKIFVLNFQRIYCIHQPIAFDWTICCEMSTLRSSHLDVLTIENPKDEAGVEEGVPVVEENAVNEEELFQSWSTNTVSSILFDVRRFEGVFDQILKQLDYLRRRQSTVFENVEFLTNNFTRLNDNVDIINSIVDKNSVYRTRRASMALGSISIDQQNSPRRSVMAAAAAATAALMSPTTPTAFAPTMEAIEPSADISGLQTELSELRTDFDELRNQFHNNHALENRFKNLEQAIQNQLKDQEKKIESLSNALREQNAVQTALQSRLDDMTVDFQGRLDAVRSDFEEKLRALEAGQQQIAKDVEVKTHALHDTLTIHDLRAKGIEGKVSNVSLSLDEVRDALNNLPTRYFDQIYASINELYADKANKRELEFKADLNLALTKADQTDVERLQGIAEELQRRLIALLAETSDKVAQMDAKLDRRSDRIVAYCLKQLKKDLKGLPSGGDQDNGNGGNTDIGKVRCLVCDHVSVQHRDQDVVQTQHERLTHTLKTLRPGTANATTRSPSPPPSNNNHNNTGFQHSPGKRTAANAGTRSSQPEIHYTEGDPEDPDYIADFKYRAPATNTSNGGTKLPQLATSQIQHLQQQQQLQRPTSAFNPVQNTIQNMATQSAPLIQIISHHVPDEVKAGGGGAQQVIGQHMYKDLDQ